MEGPMARLRSPALTDGELRIMRVLWDRGPSTVAEVVEHIKAGQKPAYNTVLTMLKILERKGYTTHEKSARAFTYVALVDRTEARKGALSYILNRFFDDSPELLVLDLLGHERTNSDELRRLRNLIDHSATPSDATPDPIDPLPKGRTA
jgi:BlaI family penicillinase repressor